MTEETSKSFNRFNASHALVLLIGLLVFVLLFLANKTHLESTKDDALSGQAPATAEEDSHAGHDHSQEASQGLIAQLPAAEPNASIDSLLQALDGTQDHQGRAVIFQGLVEMYRDAGRIDIAAVYAGQLASEQPELRNHIVAGALFRNAGFMPHFQSDSLLFRKFSDEALSHLRSAEALDGNNEDALLELGLAMAESRVPGLGMEGVLKIRKVTELNPKNVEALYRLGVFSMDTKQFDKAENRFRQVLELEPENYSASFLLAMACKELGKKAEFERLMRAVSAQTVDAELAVKAKSMLIQP